MDGGGPIGGGPNMGGGPAGGGKNGFIMSGFAGGFLSTFEFDRLIRRWASCSLGPGTVPDI